MDEGGRILPEARQGPMPADHALSRLLRNVELTAAEEIDCTTCLERVPIYVDRELAGVDAVAEMPELHLHLVQCGDCLEEYEALRDLAALESSSGLPDTATLRHQLEER